MPDLPQERSLEERAREAFADALAATSATPELAELDAAFVRAKDELERPMTVAIVGRIKAGKSTMTNALLGKPLAATGPIECTYNVNWFHYAATPSLTVHYNDGRESAPHAPGELERLTRRARENADALAGIDYIDVRTDSPLLRRFSLVDTPGLDSVHETDSANTTAFLGLRAAEITERTQLEARNADAVLYLFSRGLAASGAAVIEEFQGQSFGRATPLNAIGVLTKVDANWRSTDDPIARGDVSARAWMNEPAARRLFFAIRPVSGLIALGAATLTDAEFRALASIAAATTDATLRAMLASAKRFTSDALDAAFDADPAMRSALLDRLGPYGIAIAADFLRAGDLDRETLAAALHRKSGMADLEELVVSHFGNRAVLIKLERIVSDLRALCLRERGSRTGRLLDAVQLADAALDRLWIREHGFAELALLRRFYEGALELAPPEIDEILRVTGESGISVRQRLGARVDAGSIELVAVATKRIAHWSMRAQIAPTKATRDAAATIRRSYERLASVASVLPELLATRSEPAS